MTEAVDSSTTLESERGRDPYLFTHRETLECVLKSKCIPCLYKLFPDGVRDEGLRRIASEATGSNMEDAEKLINDLKYPKNQRPEQCPRSKVDPERSVLNLYTGLLLPESSTTDDDKLSILTVGDGDFSFSLSLANLLLNKKNETSNKIIELTMTSHESKRSVLDTYKPYVNQTLTELTNLGAIVLHDVDATNLRNTEELQKLKKKRKHHENNENHENYMKMKRYNIIIWNFPCISLPAGADGQSKELIANKQLLTRFFQNIHSCMRKEHSEVHLTHKTIEPFSWWGVKEIAKENGFDFAYAIAFDKCVYPGYTNRKALDRKSFPCHDAQTYVFVPTLRTADNTVTSTSSSSSTSMVEKGLVSTEDAKAADRCRLRFLLDRRVIVSLRDTKIAKKLWSYILTEYA